MTWTVERYMMFITYQMLTYVQNKEFLIIMVIVYVIRYVAFSINFDYLQSSKVGMTWSRTRLSYSDFYINAVYVCMLHLLLVDSSWWK